MIINIDSETSGFVRAKLVYRRPPSLRKNRERRRLCADDTRVPVSPECWGQPLIGCNVNAMTQIISGVVIGE